MPLLCHLVLLDSIYEVPFYIDSAGDHFMPLVCTAVYCS